MRLARLIGTSLLTGAALLGAAQPATAQPATARGGRGVVTVAPSSGPLNTARPGMTVWVYDGGLCADTRATATSRAFVGVVMMTPGANTLVGTTTIADVAPGWYRVTVRCDRERHTGAVDVLGSAPPRGGAATGDGSSVSGGTDSGTSGLAIAAAGVGIGGIALRRRNRRR